MDDAQIDAVVDGCNELNTDFGMLALPVVMNSKSEVHYCDRIDLEDQFNRLVDIVSLTLT